MKANKYIKGLAVLFMVMAGLMISTGRFVIAFICIILGGATLYTVTDFNKNAASIYHKFVEAPELTLKELYGLVKKMNTPLGKCWLGEHKDRKGSHDAVVFGPDPFKNYIVIYKNNNIFELKMGTDLDSIKSNLNRDIKKDILDVEGLEVTPSRYSTFAGCGVMTKVLLDDLTELTANIADGRRNIPMNMDIYKLYHYNSSDFVTRDLDGNEYARMKTLYNPLEITLRDMNDEEVVHVLAREKTPPRRMPKKGCDITVSGESYGVIRRARSGKKDVFRFDSPDGVFTLTAFPAMRRANVSCNYVIELDGVKKAVTAGMVRLDFEKEGMLSNGVVLSMDDDYLPIYIAVQQFIMGTSRFLR